MTRKRPQSIQTADGGELVPLMAPAADDARINGQRNGKASTIPSALSAYDVVDLLDRRFDLPRWIIPDILPEGLTLFGAAPKLGKTMTALAVSLRYAIRGATEAGHQVLYLSLDDTSERRLQARIRDLLAGEELPRDRLYYSLEACRLDNGLIDQLQLWQQQHPALGLVVIDVYVTVKPRRRKSADVYDSDYAALGALRQFAVDSRIAVLLIHHTRKRLDTLDWANNFSGSNGLMGSVDTLWMLERKRGATVMHLHVTGRDIARDCRVVLNLETLDLNDEWQVKPEDGGESVPGATDDLVTGMVEQRILEVLTQAGRPLGVKQIAQDAGLRYSSIGKQLRRMREKGTVLQTTYGSYQVPAGLSEFGKSLASLALADPCQGAPNQEIGRFGDFGTLHNMHVRTDTEIGTAQQSATNNGANSANLAKLAKLQPGGQQEGGKYT